MTQENLFQSLPIVAHAIAQKCGVKVILGGDQACTNGETICLPYPRDFDKNVLLGYLIHEAAHVRFSDFKLLKVAVDPAVAHLRNVYEDTRIERQIAGIYRGANALLRQTMNHVFAQWKTPQSALSIIFDFIAADCWNRYRLAGDTFSEAAPRLREAALKHFPPQLITQLESINDRIVTAQSDKDCQKMAEDVVALLSQNIRDQLQNGSMSVSDNSSNEDTESVKESEQKPSKQSKQTKKSKQSKQSQQSNDAQADDQSAMSDMNEDRSDTSKSKATQGTSSGADKHKDSSSSMSGQDGTKNSEKAIEQALEQLREFKDEDKDLSNVLKQELESKSTNQFGEGSHSADTQAQYPLDSNKAEALIAKAQQVGNGLTRQLQGLVSQAARTQRKSAMSGHALYRNKLARLTLMNPRVFERRHEHTSTASAVHILLDLSGSMSHACETAAASALSLWLALKRLPQTNPALSIFPYKNFTRVLINHGDVLTPSRRKDMSELLHCYGSTPLYEALQDVVQLLAVTAEKRKIVIVITDGRPDDLYATQRYLDRMIASGIEVFGIGLGYPIDRLIRNSVVIGDVNELSKALFALVRKTSLLAIQ